MRIDELDDRVPLAAEIEGDVAVALLAVIGHVERGVIHQLIPLVDAEQTGIMLLRRGEVSHDDADVSDLSEFHSLLLPPQKARRANYRSTFYHIGKRKSTRARALHRDFPPFSATFSRHPKFAASKIVSPAARCFLPLRALCKRSAQPFR